VTETTNQVLAASFALIIPEIVLVAAACLLFIGGTFRASRNLWAFVASASLIVAGVTLGFTPLSEDSSGPAAYAGPLFNDRLALVISWLAIIGGLVLALVSWHEVPDAQAADYYGCLLLIVAGLALTASSNELVTLFVSLELISIPSYVLLYLPRLSRASQEAAMKYFLLSTFSSALLLFGFSYLYGLAGTTNIPAMLDALTREDPAHLPAVVLIALVLVVAGLGFRITAVPFHYYAPDVYQGVSTGAAALLSFVPKVAGFTALIRILGLVDAGKAGNGIGLGDQAPIFFWILAVASMTLGNVLAILQQNIKRLLAYSSVAHAGYMLIGLAVAYPLNARSEGLSSTDAVSAIIFYLAAYGAMTVGAFAVLSFLSHPAQTIEMEDELAGLGQRRPGIALLLGIFLFSLIGIPLTAGFAGKLLLFMNALAESGGYDNLFRWLALLGAVNAAIGAYYYLRILAKMYLFPPTTAFTKATSIPGLLALLICAAVTIGFGCYPEIFLREARGAAGASSPKSIAGQTAKATSFSR
jgi:NADH-quinone oxidoreductase subunit N